MIPLFSGVFLVACGMSHNVALVSDNYAAFQLAKDGNETALRKWIENTILANKFSQKRFRQYLKSIKNRVCCLSIRSLIFLYRCAKIRQGTISRSFIQQRISATRYAL
jgi:hypothetical protein